MKTNINFFKKKAFAVIICVMVLALMASCGAIDTYLQMLKGDLLDRKSVV